MTNIQAFRVLLTKTLAIIGFVATMVLFMWLIVLGAQYAPGAFASLASTAKSISDYRPPAKELTLATEKTVVNSGESFSLSWTDMNQKHGAYAFTYACTPGVTLEVRALDGSIQSPACETDFPLSPNNQTLGVSIISKDARFADVPVTIVYAHEATETERESTTKITVVNATIPVGGIVVPEEDDVADEPIAEETPVAKPKPIAPAPKPTAPALVYPQSNPNGQSDLALTTIGIGTLERGTFEYTSSYDPDTRSALRFEVKNIGTKTSETFTFTTLLPSGTVYTSPLQPALKPGERIEYTFGFDLGETRKDFVQITSSLIVRNDGNLKNNTSVWNVKVND